MTVNRKILLLVLGLIVLVVVPAAVVLLGDETTGAVSVPTAAPAPKPAPDFELELFSGKTIKLSDFQDKKPVVLNFWASWCPPCREEAPELAKLGKRYGEDVEFIGVVTNDSQENAERFMKEFDITYENGLDRANIGGLYGLTGIPETFWIDRDGRIVDHWIGAISETDLETRVRRLIEDGSV